MAAVGTSTPVMNLVILLISGLCMGASILMSSQFGAGNYEQLSRQISTTLLSGCGFSIGFFRADNLGVRTIASADTGTEGSDAGCACVSQDQFLSEFCLRLFTIFLPIHFGHWAIVKRRCIFWLPVQFLNVLGDLLFVAVFGWGVAGSAISTVLSEASSCLFCALYIRKRVPLFVPGKAVVCV